MTQERTRVRRRDTDTATATVAGAAGSDVKAATDELLDEIDQLLEDQEHLTRYRQKGGE